ncbi:hypothetical protein FDECE_5992 [Fusarium decemcellulare]|nr:hypothetical protein FDECE_5992 [Fusarium decemcellulare]
MTLGNPADNAALPQPSSTTLAKQDMDIITRREFHSDQRNASEIRPLTQLNLYEASAASEAPQLQVASRTRANTLLFFQRAGVFSNKLMDSSVGQVSGHSFVRDFPLNSGKNARDVSTETSSKSDEVLLQDGHASVDYIGERLKESFRLDNDSIQEPSNTSYGDAARSWHVHLKNLTSPDQPSLELVGKFIRAPRFA